MVSSLFQIRIHSRQECLFVLLAPLPFFFLNPVSHAENPAMSLDVHLVRDLTDAAAGSNAAFPTLLEDRVVFVALNSAHECGENSSQVLWVTDGTAEGTDILDAGKVFGSGCQDNGFNFPRLVAGQKLFYGSASGDVWMTRGTPGAVAHVEVEWGRNLYWEGWGSVGDRVVFNREDGCWASDGTLVGTERIWSLSFVVANLGDRSTFSSQEDGKLGVTDGTSAGTQILDMLPQPVDWNPGELQQLSGRLLFLANDGVHGREPWITDGTIGGTFLVKDLNPAGDSCHLFVVGDGHVAFFVGVTDWACGIDQNWTQKFGLWVTDGTSVGTHFVENVPLPPGFWPGGRYSAIVIAGKLFVFGGRADDGGGELWVSDGRPDGTRRLGSFVGTYQHNLAALGNSLAFVADDGVHGRELWLSDGTSGGTHLVSDLVPGAEGSEPEDLTTWQDRLFFSATTVEHGRELWMTDGTGTGTAIVGDICPGPCSSDPGWYGNARRYGSLNGDKAPVPLGDKLLFPADDGVQGRELWAVQLLDGFKSPPFHRGDPNSSGTIDISDGIAIFGFLFLGDPQALSCKESADANNDGKIDISDGIYLLSWLFTGGPEPTAPGSTTSPCGFDPDPSGSPGDFGCASYHKC